METPALGMVGLGRMGSNLMRRFVRAGGTGAVHDTSPAPAEALRDELRDAGYEGAVTIAETLDDLVSNLAAPRVVWVMVPSEFTGDVVEQLAAVLEPGDTVIDGGNSDWRHDADRAAMLERAGIDFLDVGTSGGVWGLDRGYCLMVGGPDSAVQRVAPVFDIISPAFDSVERTSGRSGGPAPSEQGWLHCGPTGAGHFVKMVHNGIEYGIMAAYAEGFSVLARADTYGFDIDQGGVAELWRRGSVIGSWLLDLAAAAYAKDPELSEFSGYVSDSGEGRWTLEAAIDLGVPTPVLAGALFSRFASRNEGHRANQILSALRNEFGGHVEPTEPTP